jgi:hypothetical protein
MGRLLNVPEIPGNDITHPGNLRQFISDFRDPEVKMLGTNKKDIVVPSFPDRFKKARHQLDEAAGLLELLILLEKRNDVLKPGVKGVGRFDLVGQCFGATIGGFRSGGLFQLAAKCGCDILDFSLAGERLEEAFAQDVKYFVGGKINRRDASLLAAQLGARILKGAINEFGAGIVGCGQIGYHHADIFLFAGGGQQVGKCAGGNIRDGAVSDLLGVKIVEIGRHLVKQDKDRLVSIEKLEPVFLVRGLGTAGPEGRKLICLAELIGDLSPEKMIGIIAAVESGDVSACKGYSLGHPTAVSFPKPRMFGKQSKANQEVGLATAHGLLQVKNRLGRRSGQPGKPFTDEILHALGDEGFLEKRLAFPL